MLYVQKFLETHSLIDLEKEHGVYASFSKSKLKFSLNYSQIESVDSDILAQECRGIILSESSGKIVDPNSVVGKTRVIAFPMKRFFNNGQGSAANIDWSNCVVMEKLDGTLCIVYFDHFDSKWHIATRSVPEADIPLNDDYTFRKLFEKSLFSSYGLTFSEFTSKLNANVTYFFELTTPINRIVVSYNDYNITLLGARYVYDGLVYDKFEEIPLSEIDCPIRKVKTYNFGDEKIVENIVDWVLSVNPMEHEGVVVCDAQFNRIKIKSPSYTFASRAKDEISSSTRNCIKIILLEKDDDVISFLPQEYQEKVLKIKSKIQNLFVQYDSKYAEIYNFVQNESAGNRKLFAEKVMESKYWHEPFFKMFSGKSKNMKEFVVNSKGVDGSWSNSFLDKISEMIDI